MPDVMIHGDTFRSPELRHEVPIGIPDAFLYVEINGEKHVVIGSLEVPQLAALNGYMIHPTEEYGRDDLIAQGVKADEIQDELLRRAAVALGVKSAVVPNSFPLHAADVLRQAGVELTTNHEFFDSRRRVKSPWELAGIRRAQRAAAAGMEAGRELLRRATSSGGVLEVDREPLTSERLKAVIARAFIDYGASAEDFIVSHGPQSAAGHHRGSGQLKLSELIVIDLWPRDNESGCYADMTRTFVVGDVPDELREWHRLVKQSLDDALSSVRDGAECRSIYNASCEVFEAAGLPTARTKEPGTPLEEGYYGLGHGVGLEVHEQPILGRISQSTLRAGDVVTLEPGLYRPSLGGLRLEDLVLVTADGAENLTQYPYDLVP